MPTLDNYSLGNYGLGGFDKDAPLELLGSGSVTSSSGVFDVYRFDTGTQFGTSYHVTVTGQSFGKIPNIILLKRGTLTEGVYVRDAKNVGKASLITFGGAYGSVSDPYWYVNNTTFRLPVVSTANTYTWEAWG
ncbi:MAG: hypothetical protein ABS894_00695 [Aerococcus urinaeequi]